MSRKKTLIYLVVLVAIPLAIAANYRIDIGKVWKSLELQPGCTVINRDGNDIADQLDVLDSINSTDLGKVDGITNGTAAANKALVLGASKEIATITTATVTTGNIATVNATDVDAGASGTAGTVDVFPATASRGKVAITAADSAGNTTTTIVNASQAAARTYTIPDAGGNAEFVMSAGAQSIAGAKTFTSQILTTYGVGAVAGTGVAITSEKGDGVVHQSVLTLTNVAVALSDEAGVIAYGGLKVYDLPEGAIAVLGAVTDLDLTKSSAGVIDAWDGDIALGTVTAANDADLTGTEADIVAKTSTPQAAAGVTTGNAANAGVGFLNGAGGAKDVYVNLLVDDADHDVAGTACNLILNGTITLTWINAGDY